MAPSATETVTTNLVNEAAKLKLYPGAVEGAYKELSSVSYQKEQEEHGSEDFKAAKVSRLLSVSRDSAHPTYTHHSIPTTSRPGTRIRHTLPSSLMSIMTMVRMLT